jgi:glyoxylase-like metal-dependent hydrolase (beta-lactamase superfamily II)
MEPRIVVPGIHVLALEPANAYLWEWGEGLTVIDTGLVGSADAILRGVAVIGRRPEDVKEIVLTHYHDDHRGGAAELVERTGAAVLAHRADAPVIRGHMAQLPPVLTEAERALAAVSPRMPRGPSVGVDRELEEGDTTSGGGVVVSVPGHTPGSMALFLPQLKALFTGDVIASDGRDLLLGIFNVDRAAAVEAVRKVAGLDVGTACFGHGPPGVGAAGAQIRALAESL